MLLQLESANYNVKSETLLALVENEPNLHPDHKDDNYKDLAKLRDLLGKMLLKREIMTTHNRQIKKNQRNLN